MSDTDDSTGIVSRSIFDRVASSINTWMKEGIVEFRFIRGGTFRASVVKERLASVLTLTKIDKSQFDKALSEVVVYLNALVFDLGIDVVVQQIRMQSSRFNAVKEGDDSFYKEAESRFDYVKNNVALDRLKSRAHLRLNATSLTYDDLSWSITRGRLQDSDEKIVVVESVGVILSLFVPGFGQPAASPFGINLNDLGSKVIERITFTLDENDVDDLISELEKLRKVLRGGGRK